jgi:putative nucleotidyltransferase with HDIG domain
MAEDQGHYLTAEQLRPGIFVILDLPWFKHNFTLNSFKIRTEDQVRELRALELTQYRYDPERSEGLDNLQSMPEQATTQQQDKSSGTDATAAALDPAAAIKLQRLVEVNAWRSKVENVEKAFGKATAVMKNLNRNLLARPKETLEDMGAVLGQMIGAFLESPDATLHVMGDKVGGEEVYYHSLNVTILAMMLAKDLGFTPEVARELGVGAMVHDIGLMEIPDKVTKKNPDEYTSSERSFRAQHVDYGVAIGRKIGLSPQALAVIAQHHELIDGSGYPKGAKADALTPAARLVAVVNTYDNLCNPFDINKAMTPHEALSFMYAKKRDKFDSKVLQLMIRCLGVYPPGSIVQLSNESLAVVTSVNPKKPLRPWIMVYDPKVPKEQAVLIDLEKATEINITKSIRPALLAPKVAAYLNPRKRVTYFFDSGSTGAPPAR